MINILISTYNGEKYIKDQLKSIEEQTYPDYHVYIRDDGSKDGTVGRIKEYIETSEISERFSLSCGENLGFMGSFKELLMMASEGDYWAFCDQDDYWYPERLEKAFSWFEKQKKASSYDPQEPLLYYSQAEIANEDLSERKPYSLADFDYGFRNSFTVNIFFGFSMVINRALYERLIRADFSRLKYHDWFAAMIVTAFGRYHISESMDSAHRMHGDNTSAFFFLKKIPEGIRLLKGDDFYARNAREFYRLFGRELNREQRYWCRMFINDKYRFKVAFRKAFYPKRWNPQLKVEIIQRVLMLFGKI